MRRTCPKCGHRFKHRTGQHTRCGTCGRVLVQRGGRKPAESIEQVDRLLARVDAERRRARWAA